MRIVISGGGDIFLTGFHVHYDRAVLLPVISGNSKGDAFQLALATFQVVFCHGNEATSSYLLLQGAFGNKPSKRSMGVMFNP